MKRIITAAAVAAGLAAMAAPVTAQQYPNRTVTIIVPYSAGGPVDQLARVIATALSAKLNQNFVVENVTGGSTITGTNKVVHSAPDGYTLLVHNLQISANATLFKSLPYDTEKDLAPVMFIYRNPLVLIGRKSLAANSLDELLAAMKKQRMKAAIPGFGSTGHLATALLAQEAKVPIDIIPYRGGAPMLTDVLGDHVDISFGTPQQVGPFVAAGKLRAFGVTQAETMPEFPQAGSFVKMFGPKFDIQFWEAMFAPAGTPAAVIKTLNAALEDAVVTNPALLKQWAAEGVSAYPKDQRSPEAGRAILKSEIDRWGKLINDNNIQVNQ
ncbi:MAG TPA: tripartite tricarboxylate transporter substrate-binding protein [Pseudolabrys sp.]|nr:tripartite tricarboxylate transporter substrate-binding protein [Pseudolabrys sp.]